MSYSTFQAQIQGQANPQRAIYPGGVDAVLAILGLGATGELRTAIEQHFSGEKGMIDHIVRVNRLDETPETKSKNGLFFDSNYSTINPDYYNKLVEFVHMVQEDFKTDASGAVERINAWIEVNTGFKNILKIGDVRGAALVVVNTLWFRDEWVNHFRLTEIEDFVRLNSHVVRLQMMTKTSKYGYFLENGVTAVRIPFKGGAVAELVMGLPWDSGFEQQFDYAYDREVALTLPRFEHRAEINIQPILEKAGYGDLFQAGSLGGINDEDLYVSKFEQVIYIRFDEKGAEVKAVTYAAVRAALTMARPSEPLVIRFDRPFHYRIVQNEVTLVSGFFNGQ